MDWSLVGGWSALAMLIVLLAGWIMNRINNEVGQRESSIDQLKIDMNTKINSAMPRELCSQKHGSLSSRLDVGDLRFKEICEKIDHMTETLIKVDTKLILIAKKNGISYNDS